jgi:uncharacterized protein
MTVKAQLQEDLKTAMRNKDEVRKAVLRLTLAAVKNAEIDKRGELDDAGVMAVLQTEVKRRRDTLAELEKADRPDLLAAEKAEIEHLLPYLPQQMSREEIEAAARAVIAEMSASGTPQTGEVMKRLMADLKGKADGRLVNQVVKELL